MARLVGRASKIEFIAFGQSPMREGSLRGIFERFSPLARGSGVNAAPPLLRRV